MSQSCDLTGQKFGKLTALKRLEEKDGGYLVWLCRCECGNTVKVDTRRLKRGTVTSCGCTAKKNAKKGQRAEDIRGQRFGRLVAVKRAENLNGRTAWECRCDCGRTHIVMTKELKFGKCRSCGCLRHEKYKGMADLTGNKYGRLTVLFPTEKRDSKGSVFWHCRCDCGNEVEVSADGLMHGNHMSCGCYRREEIWDHLHDQLHLIDGTCVEMLEKRKKRSDNKSGFRGVYHMKNGKYRVGIGFKGKTYYITTTRSLEDAITQRLEAEKKIHDGFIKAYYQWEDEMKDINIEERVPLVYEIEKINGEFVIHTNMRGNTDE